MEESVAVSLLRSHFLDGSAGEKSLPSTYAYSHAKMNTKKLK
jgi:hypothetical protein